MSRQLISCLVLLLLSLQGIAAVRATVSVENSASVPGAVHCPDHHAMGHDCPCCGDTQVLNGGCAALCAASAIPPALAFFRSTHARNELTAFLQPPVSYLTYPPPNPPPIY